MKCVHLSLRARFKDRSVSHCCVVVKGLLGNSWWVHITHTTLQSGAGHIGGGGGGGGAPFDEREEEIGTIDGEEEPRNTKEEE